MADFVRGPFAIMDATVCDRLNRCAGCRVQCSRQCVCVRAEVELEGVLRFYDTSCHTIG